MRLPLVYWLIAAAILANTAVYLWPEPRPPEIMVGSGKGLGDLVLLKELEGSARLRPIPGRPEGDETAAGVADASDSRLPSTSAGSCWLAGPVEDESLSTRLAAELAAAGVSMDLVLQTTEVAPTHWVYIRTSGSQADVRRLSRVMREAGWENFPITDGPLLGNLSVGLFRDERRAASVRDRLLTAGYAADIYRRTSFRDQPWLVLDSAGREALGWPGREGPLPGYRGLRLVAGDCP